MKTKKDKYHVIDENGTFRGIDKPQHTPTPWEIKEGWEGEVMAQGHLIMKSYDCRTVEGKANAAFIVRAVNAHEELLRWAKQYAFDCEHNEPHLKGGNLDLLKQAIAKAEGK